MAQAGEKITPLNNLGPMQRKTSRFAGNASDSWLSQNTSFDEIGSVKKGKGYLIRNEILTTTTSTSTSSSTTTTSTSTSTTTSTSTSTSTS